MKLLLRWLFRRRRCLKHFLLIFCVVYMFILLFIHGAVLGSLSLCILLDMSCSLTPVDLWTLMIPNKLVPHYSNQSVSAPLAKLYLPSSNALHFFDLPKSKSSVVFGEITTANRNTKYRLAPDFTFHVKYDIDRVVLYEDYGPGCVFRIYLYPALPTDSKLLYKITPQHLHNLSLFVQVDGNNFTYPLDEMILGSAAPFIWPFSTKHSKPSSGIGAYTPICYQESIVISYVHDKPFIPDLLKHIVNCTLNELQCDTKIYSAISRHKYPYGVKMNPHRGDVADKSEINRLARVLSHPESYGPGSSEHCTLSCVQVCAGCQRVLYHTIHTAGVLAAIKFRVFEEEERSDWMDILLSVYVDDSLAPQIDRIPLGSLFGAAGSLHDHQGVAFGRRIVNCRYEGVYDKPSRMNTGYLFLPIPFWTELLVVIERSTISLGDPTICYQLTLVDNFYDAQNTGHLYIKKSYYGEDVGRWREVANIKEGSGHVVGIGVEIDNLRALRGVPLSQRWSALQADPVIYIDGAPTVLGTGLEDYFSYSHGFTGAENTTYAFVGVHHAGQPPSQLEPLTWHCYRQHVLDPISFTQSLHFIMEGTNSENHKQPAKSLSYLEHHQRKEAGNTTFAHIVYYYFLPHASSNKGKNCDIIQLGNLASETKHRFQMNINDFKNSDNKFQLIDARYIGDSATDNTFTGNGRFFNKGDKFAFTMSLEGSSSIVLLRRTYHMRAWHWNSKSKVSLNDMEPSIWFIPMGTLDEEYSIGVDQITFYVDHIRNDMIRNKSMFLVSFEVLTEWRDISYEVCFV